LVTRKRKKTPEKQTPVSVFLFVLFIMSFGLIIWAIAIYRLTIIPASYILIIGALGTGICAFLFLLTTMKYFSVFWLLFQAAVIGGGIFVFVFLFINEQAAARKITVSAFDIIRNGNLESSEGCAKPYVVILFDRVEKEFLFDCAYEKSVKSFKKLQLSYYHGVFGFDVVTNKTLLP
jgi:hypothetical protein